MTKVQVAMMRAFFGHRTFHSLFSSKQTFNCCKKYYKKPKLLHKSSPVEKGSKIYLIDHKNNFHEGNYTLN